MFWLHFNDLEQVFDYIEEKLIKACDAVRACFDTELHNLPSKLPAMPSEYAGTKASKFYSSLRSSQTESMLTDILVWTKKDTQSLEDFEERLKTNDPEKQARIKRNQKEQIGLLYSDLTKAISKITIDTCGRIYILRNKAKGKRKAAIEGARVVQELSPLPGVGS